ncbi:MAG: HAMP domain-containing protein [Victivallales bacterium]|nr:HAMP domain-containing protein [Victivallales bacterium]MBT7162393.1 HAMP domain-containing protein [Victivallales bacterium]
MKAPRRRLAVQLTLVCGTLVAVCLALAVGPMLINTRRNYVSRATAQFERQLARLHKDLVVAAARDDHDQLDLLCNELNGDYQGRVSLIAPDGSIMADSMSARCVAMARRDCIPAIRHERRKMLERAQPLSDTVAIRLRTRLGAVGPATVRLALPIQPVREEMRKLGQWLLVATVLAMAAAVLAAVMVSRRIARPVEQMTSLAERIATGNLESKAPMVGGASEIGRLAEALGAMQQSLRQNMSDLRRERNQALAIVGAMADGVLALQADGRTLFANQAAGELLGTEIPNDTPLADLTLPEPVRQLARRVLDSQTPAEETLGDERRGERVIGIAGTPVPTDRSSGGAVLVLRDISEARRAAALGRELVANASHELRTPLAIVESSADTLLGAVDELPADLREFVDIISRNSRRMAGLVNETLELSKLESGGETQWEHADLADLAHGAIDPCRPWAAAKGLDLQIDLAAQAPVQGDCSHLASALRNLLENAIHYTPATGRIGVSLTLAEGHASFSVSDSGPGIPEADRKRIFERFYRGDEAALKRAEGSGLGLAIVRRVAELHGGTISVESTVGQGSTFTLRIPLA